MRTLENYAEDMKKECGVKAGGTPFNDLKNFTGFHCVMNYFVDIAHDIPEGVLQKFLPFMLHHFIYRMNYFTMKELNEGIRDFKCWPHSSPLHQFNPDSYKSERGLPNAAFSCSMAQGFNLILAMPALVGGYIPMKSPNSEDKWWKAFKWFYQITIISLSPKVTEAMINLLTECVSDFIWFYNVEILQTMDKWAALENKENRRPDTTSKSETDQLKPSMEVLNALNPQCDIYQIYKDNSPKYKPVTVAPFKVHVLSHYPRIIRQCGPLVHQMTMRQESKHQQLKGFMRNSKNFKNVCFSMTKRHQIRHAALLSKNSKFGNFSKCIIEESNVEKLWTFKCLDEQMTGYLSSIFAGITPEECVVELKEVTVDSCGLRVGDHIFVGQAIARNSPKFATIKRILTFQGSCYFLVTEVITKEPRRHFSSFSVEIPEVQGPLTSSNSWFIDVEDVPYKKPIGFVNVRIKGTSSFLKIVVQPYHFS